MKLKVLEENKPEYISYSAFSQWSRCRNLNYYTRISKEINRGEYSYPALVGLYWDALITCDIAETLEFPLDLETELKSIQENINKEALTQARELYISFKKFGLMQELMDRDIGNIHHTILLDLTDPDGFTIPIKCIPDLVFDDGTVHEFKVNGAGSKYGQSPKQGYKSAVTMSGQRKGNHKLYGEKLENLDVPWATQLAIGSWCNVSPFPFRDINASVSQCAVRPSGYTFAHFEATISAPFQANLWEQLKTMWTEINTEFEMDSGSQSRCFAFGRKCEAADICPSFKDYQKSKKAFDELV